MKLNSESRNFAGKTTLKLKVGIDEISNRKWIEWIENGQKIIEKEKTRSTNLRWCTNIK